MYKVEEMDHFATVEYGCFALPMSATEYDEKPGKNSVEDIQK